MKIENSQRPAKRYLAQRVISFRNEHGDPTVKPIIEYCVKKGVACTHRYEDGKLCGAPMKAKSPRGPRCARHAGKKR